MSQMPKTFKPYTTSTPSVPNTMPWDKPPTGVPNQQLSGQFVITAKPDPSSPNGIGYDYWLNGNKITREQWEVSGLDRGTYEGYAKNEALKNTGYTPSVAGTETGGDGGTPVPSWDPETALDNYNNQKKTLDQLWNQGIISYENRMTALEDARKSTMENISGYFSAISPEAYQSQQGAKEGQTKNTYDVGATQVGQQKGNYGETITGRRSEMETAYATHPEYFDPAYGAYTDFSADVPSWEQAAPSNPQDILNQFEQLKAVKNNFANAPAILTPGAGAAPPAQPGQAALMQFLNPDLKNKIK